MPLASPPRSEEELLVRARALAGRTLAQLAGQHHIRVPSDQRRAKGWAGQLVEMCLGATASSRAAPDFERIGVELKTIPIGRRGQPTESTYVCHAQLTDLNEVTWSTSWVCQKLSRVLWLPIQASPEVPLGERRIGSALLWSPDAEEEAALRADWEELTERIRLGQVESITGHDGQWLQIRPKGADSRAECWGVDEHGHRFRTLPRGFYLRATFTAWLLSRHFIVQGG